MLFHKKPNTPPMVYLDQMKWIDLARAYYKQERGTPFAATLQKVQDAVQHQTARFPLSCVHVIETMKMGTLARRSRLARVMAEISEGWTIAPAEEINSYEFKMAVPKALNRAVTIESPVVFGRGIEFAFGYPIRYPTFINALASPDDRIKKRAIYYLRLILQAPDESLRKPGVKHYHETMNAIASEAEETRNLVKNGSKILQKRAFTARFAFDHFHGREADLRTVLEPLGVSFDEFFHSLGKEGLEALFTDMPTTDISMNLRTQRNMQYQKPIEPNDLDDQSFLSVAIPYCDIVVTEKQWVDLAKRKQLDKKYMTQLVSDLKDLVDFL